MAHVQKLPDDALNAIAKQVGRLYPSLDENVTQHQPSAELRETFPVWFLSIDEIAIGKDNLLEIAQNTNRWHSQIWVDGKPKGVVRFMATNEDALNWTVRQVLKGDLAEKVEDTIDWIDREIKADPLVYILEIPTLFTTAFWLIDEKGSSVVIAKCPEYLHSLSPLVQYSSQDFLRVLREESHAIGIHNERSGSPSHLERTASERKTFNVLTISGDGIADIVPAMILEEIEERTGLPTADNFDFIIGKSTGRILALGLSARNNNGEPEYKARDLVDIYESLRNGIFNFSVGDVASSLKTGISPATEQTGSDHFYPDFESVLGSYFQSTIHDNFESVLGSYFQGTTLGNVLEQTKAMVAHYDIGIGAWTRLFPENWASGPASMGVWHAASVMSTAPMFFSPVVSVYEEAKRMISGAEPFKNLHSSDIFLLSIGDVQTTTDFQQLSSSGYNCISLHTSQGEVETYTNLKDLADQLIESAEFNKVCDRLMSEI